MSVSPGAWYHHRARHRPTCEDLGDRDVEMGEATCSNQSVSSTSYSPLEPDEVLGDGAVWHRDTFGAIR